MNPYGGAAVGEGLLPESLSWAVGVNAIAYFGLLVLSVVAGVALLLSRPRLAQNSGGPQ